MALGQCRECKNEVSTEAKICPHCGISNPITKPSETAAGVFGLLVLIGITVYACSPDTKPNPAAVAAQAAKKADEDATTKAIAAAQESKCMKDLACWSDKNIIGAGIYCKHDIEKLAKYSVRWTDEMMEMKFSKVRWLDQEKGTLTYIGDKIEFQNGFGAYQASTYECDFQPENHVILDVRAAPGRL